MRVQKQSSGGRGEYELADSHGDLSPSDLLDLELHALWGPFGYRRSGLAMGATAEQGKSRLRTIDGAAHFPIQLATGLLLPHPIREESRLDGGPFLILQGNYLVDRVQLKNVVKRKGFAQIEFGDIHVTNGTLNDTENFDERLARVVSLHARHDRLPDELNAMIVAHQTLLKTDRPITRRNEGMVREIMRELEDVAADYDLSYVPGTDPLPALEKIVADMAAVPSEPLDALTIDSIPDDELELRRRFANRVQRMVAVRGAKSVKFRRDVTKAYRFRCVVCGMRFPKNTHCIVPGVDAAHILAWRDVDLDEIRNGLCLCKTHHWAFDQQLISVQWHEESAEYTIQVTELAEKAFGKDSETLAALRKLERIIPRQWLPRLRQHWPHRQALQQRMLDIPPIV
jgi:putative restriction endonuclease